jgi:hypothetical protein
MSSRGNPSDVSIIERWKALSSKSTLVCHVGLWKSRRVSWKPSSPYPPSSPSRFRSAEATLLRPLPAEGLIVLHVGFVGAEKPAR